MSATRCFSCIAFPFPRVVLGSKNIRASKAAPVKSQRSPARATNLVVPQRQCLQLVVDLSRHRFLPPTLEGQCRLLLYCNTHFKNLAYRTLGDGLPLFTELPRRGVPGNRASGDADSRKLKPLLPRCSFATLVTFL